jgi:hypothetical protein
VVAPVDERRPPHPLEAQESSAFTVRQLYERTLKALCRWLPRIFQHITYQGCMLGGQKALRSASLNLI